MTLPDCQSTRYKDRQPCTFDGARFDVVYTLTNGKEADRHPACFTHGIAEVERHHAAAGMAKCDLVGPVRGADGTLAIPEPTKQLADPETVAQAWVAHAMSHEHDLCRRTDAECKQVMAMTTQRN